MCSDLLLCALTALLSLLALFGALLLLLSGVRCRKTLDEMLFFFVTRAEGLYAGGTGALKFAYVYTCVRRTAPLFARLFYSPDKFKILIENALQRAKTLWQRDLGIELYLNDAAETHAGAWRELSFGKEGQP